MAVRAADRRPHARGRLRRGARRPDARPPARRPSARGGLGRRGDRDPPAPPRLMDLVGRVRETIASRRLLGEARSILAAVSGGPDSTAMLIALAEVAPGLGLTLGVAAVDH